MVAVVVVRAWWCVSGGCLVVMVMVVLVRAWCVRCGDGGDGGSAFVLRAWWW